MARDATPPSAARAARLLHGVIALGLVVVAGSFALIVRVLRGPILTQAPQLGTVMATAAALMLLGSTGLLRRQVPRREASQLPDAYWGDSAVRARALILWAGLEGAGIVASVGYLLTGPTAPAVAAGAAMAVLILMGPARLEG